jgi:hypothetical protein
MGGIIMGRPGKPVYKFDQQGNQLDKYPSLNKAAEANNMTVNAVNYYIRLNRSCHGARFSLSESLEPEGPKGKRDYPWEKDGFFSVEGWATVCV